MLDNEPVLMICPVQLAECWWRPLVTMGVAVEFVEPNGLLLDLNWTHGFQMLTEESAQLPLDLSSLYLDLENCRSVEAQGHGHQVIVLRCKKNGGVPPQALEKCWIYFRYVQPFGPFLARVLLASGARFATWMVICEIARQQIFLNEKPSWDDFLAVLRNLGFHLGPLNAADPFTKTIERQSYVAKAYSGYCIDGETGEPRTYLALGYPATLREFLAPSKSSRSIYNAVTSCGWTLVK